MFQFHRQMIKRNVHFITTLSVHFLTCAHHFSRVHMQVATAGQVSMYMHMGARAVRLQCTAWTSVTAKSTHAHYVRMRITKCIVHVSMFSYHEATTVAALRMENWDNIFNRQTFAIKIVQIIKYKISCRFKKGLLICGTKPWEGCSQCQVLPLILLITSPLTYGLPIALLTNAVRHHQSKGRCSHSS